MNFKSDLSKKCGNYAPPFFKFVAAPLLSLVVDEENVVIGFGPPTLEMLPPSLPRWPSGWSVCFWNGRPGVRFRAGLNQ